MKSRLNYLALVVLLAVAVVLPARADNYKGTITFQVVKEFDVAAGAKKYGISVSGNTKKTKEKSGGTNTKKKKTK